MNIVTKIKEDAVVYDQQRFKDKQVIKLDKNSRTIETSISIGHIKDLIEEELRRHNWVTDDEEVVHFVFGKIAPMWENAKSLNGYLNLEIPLTIALNKQERKQSEIKVRVYE